MTTAADTISAAMRQWERFKKHHIGCILFVEVGDFVEAYDEDAHKVHNAIGATMTTRTTDRMARVQMVGIPRPMFEKTAQQLIRAGYRVAIAEQVTDDPRDEHTHTAREEQDKRQQLTERSRKLAEAIEQAKGAADEWRDVEDGGTCNFDAPLVYMPRMATKQIKAIAQVVGFPVDRWEHIGQKGWLIINIPMAGQGERRTKMAEAAKRSLEAQGYTATVHYAMD